MENILQCIGLKPGMTVRRKSDKFIPSAGITIENLWWKEARRDKRNQ